MSIIHVPLMPYTPWLYVTVIRLYVMLVHLNGIVTTRARTILARLLTGYDYGTPKVSSHISHVQSSQSA